MTKRAVVLGLLGVAAICGLSHLNSSVLQQTPLVGNSLPLAVYGGLIILVIAINPWLRKRSLNGKELAVILAVTLAGSAVPGVFRTFFPAVVIPHQMQHVKPGWKAEKVIEKLPPEMLVEVTDADSHDHVVLGFMRGLGEGVSMELSLSDIPWAAWSRTLLFWLPILITLWVALIGLSLVVHRQWSDNEKLPYPIATFTSALLPKERGQTPEIFKNRLFWIAAGLVLAIHLNNYFVACLPDYGISIPTTFDFRPLGQVFPVLVKGGGTGLLSVHVYFVIIGLAYLIPKEVSLSFGIGPFLWYILMGILLGYGINLTAPQVGTGYFALRPQSFALFGASVGVMIMILYNGRQFYAATARKAVGLSVKSEVDTDTVSVLGLRIFLVTFVLLIVQLMLVGVDLVVALPYALIMIMGFLVMGRIIAETGLIYMKCYFWPCAILWGVVGVRTIGPKQMMILMMLSTILFIDPREALLPFMTNSLKVLQERQVKLKKPAMWCIAALVVGLAVAVPTTLYLTYRSGGGDDWATKSVPSQAFNNATEINYRLASSGVTVDEEGSALMRISDWSPNWLCITVALVGLVLVLLFALASLRLPHWPLHPLLFVTWASTPLLLMGTSFLLGWAVKTMVVRFGGAGTYNRVKPLMYGLIAGELLGGVLPILIGTGYYFVTGELPVKFRILP